MSAQSIPKGSDTFGQELFTAGHLFSIWQMLARVQAENIGKTRPRTFLRRQMFFLLTASSQSHLNGEIVD